MMGSETKLANFEEHEGGMPIRGHEDELEQA